LAATLLLVLASTALASRTYESQITQANGSAFSNPTGLAVDSSDNLWVSDTDTHIISKFDSSGTYLAQNDGTGSWGTSTYNQSLAYGKSASLIYGVDSNADDIWGIHQSDATYAGVDIFGGAWDTGAHNGCCFIRGAVDNSGGADDGDIYVTGTGSTVTRVDGSGAAASFSGSASYISGNQLTGTPAHAFASLTAVAVDASGNVYVGDAGNLEVDEFDATGTFVKAFTGLFGSISAVAIDPTNGDVLIADSSQGVVHELDSSGASVGDIDSTGTPGAPAFSPQGVAVDSTGTLYVADGANRLVDVFGTSGPPPVTHDVDVSATGAGTGTVTSSPAGINCGATCSHGFNENSTVTLTATPAAHSTFTGWTVDGSTSTCPGTGTCDVPIGTTDHTVVADFEPTPQHNVDVSASGTGSGTVTSNAGAINCPGTCTDHFDENTSVTLSATPVAHSRFTGWMVDGSASTCPGTGSCVVAIGTSDHTVVANFDTIAQHTLTVAKAGTGAGTVSSSPAGITCGGTCSASFDEGSGVTLTAAPVAGSTFTGWSGPGAASCSGTGTCHVTIPAAATSVTATFAQNAPTVTTTAGATGITQHTATVAGTVNPNAGNVTNCHIEYGTTTSYGSQAPCSPAPGAGSSAVGVSAALSGLAPGTTYHFRVVATNAGNTTNGSDQTFTTLADTCATNATLCPPPPTCATNPALCPKPTPGVLKLTAATATVSSGKAAVKLSCKGATTCTGTVKLTIKTKVRKGKKTTTKTLTIGTARVRIAAGHSATVNITLSSTARKLLAKKHTLSATLSSPSLKHTIVLKTNKKKK
jgi:hypothetical protein